MRYMTLLQWKIKNGYTWAGLAHVFGVSDGNIVRRWCLPLDDGARKIPRREMMLKIYELTNGEVEPNDFYLKPCHDA